MDMRSPITPDLNWRLGRRRRGHLHARALVLELRFCRMQPPASRPPLLCAVALLRLRALAIAPQDSGIGSKRPPARADGRWRLYYAGRETAGGPWRGIGIALTDDVTGAELEGVRLGFRRRRASSE